MANFRDRDSGSSRGGPRRFSDRDGGRRSFNRSRERGSRRPGNFNRKSFDNVEMTEVICDSCKNKCEVPFKPTPGKPVYCDDCFKKESKSRPSSSNNYSEEFIKINQKLDKIMEKLELD